MLMSGMSAMGLQEVRFFMPNNQECKYQVVKVFVVS